MTLEKLCGVQGGSGRCWQSYSPQNPNFWVLSPNSPWVLWWVSVEETMALLSRCLVFHRQANSINSFYKEKNPKNPQKIKY